MALDESALSELVVALRTRDGDPLRPRCHQDGKHSYGSAYGRLWWDEPAQTITSGFSSISQGRFMHPEELRALTAHEAARLQGFPDYFDFSGVQKRTDLATMIGNAVPPALTRELFGVLFERAESRCESCWPTGRLSAKPARRAHPAARPRRRPHLHQL